MKLVDLNVCKNNRCENFGITNANGFYGPVYRLGFRAYHCQKCDSYPPVLDNSGFTLLWSYIAEKIGKLTAKICPYCASETQKRFGSSANGKVRYRCKSCFRTYSRWSPKQEFAATLPQLMQYLGGSNDWLCYVNNTALQRNQIDRQLTQFSALAQQHRYEEQPAQRVATLAFTIPYKGIHQGEQNRMWVLWSCDVDSGKVLLVTSNWCPFLLPQESLYQYSQPNSESLEHQSSAEVKALEAAEKRSQRFLQRSQFDQLDYGPSYLQAKTEAVAKPVLTAHAHWRALHALGHGRHEGEHYLYHEVFLRGACMTQFAAQVRQGKCRIFYVSGQNDGLIGELVDSKTLGWWQNRWYLYRQADKEYAVTALVPGVSLRDTSRATLAPCYQFADLLQQQGWLEIFKQTSPSRVNALLQCLATQFNQSKDA